MSPPATGLLNIASNDRMVVAIDEAIGSGLEIQVTEGNNLLPADIAQDIETTIRNSALIGGGGAKAGNLSYLNTQVRFVNGVFTIESGTVTDKFTGSGRSSVAVGEPAAGTDVRDTLGLNLTVSSEDLASRQVAETTLASAYSTGDILTVVSTAGFLAGDAIEVRNSTTQQIVLVSGAGTTDDLPGADIRFTVASGISTNLDAAYAIGDQVRKFHPVSTAEPVSAVTSVDQLYRFQIDSIVNQIDFSA